MENYDIELEVFINLAWEKAVEYFGENALYKEREFKKYFKDELEDEFYRHLDYHILVKTGCYDNCEEGFTSKEAKEEFINVYKDLDYITLSFGFKGGEPTDNFSFALMRAGLSDDGGLPFYQVEDKHTTIELPKHYEFDFYDKKII